MRYPVGHQQAAIQPRHPVGHSINQSAIGRPWEPSGDLWSPLGAPWDDLGSPWETFGAPSERLRNPLGLLWSPFGTPWDDLGSPLGNLSSPLGASLARENFEIKTSKLAKPSDENWSDRPQDSNASTIFSKNA